MSAEYTYDYAIVRVVPRVERGERINVGVILSCVDVEFLDARIELDTARLLALDPALDLEAIRAGLASDSARSAPAAPARVRSASCRRAAAFAGWCRRAAPSSRCRPSTPDGPATPRPPWSDCSTRSSGS